MTGIRKLVVAIALSVITAFAANNALAVQPDEVLPDPQLEARARTISKDLRCMVCQNQSIDDSDATLARDLRILVRERLVAGDTNDEVIDFVVSRYGEFVLLKPQFSAQNLLLWGAPVLLLLIGGFVLFRKSRSPASVSQEARLSDEEKAALARILDTSNDGGDQK